MYRLLAISLSQLKPCYLLRTSVCSTANTKKPIEARSRHRDVLSSRLEDNPCEKITTGNDAGALDVEKVASQNALSAL